MEDILQGYGIKPQGKSAPMAASKTANPVAGNFNFNFTANNPKSSSLNPKSSSLNDAFGTNPGRNTFAEDFAPYDDVFGGPPQYRSHSVHASSGYDDIFQSFPSAPSKSSTGPIFDAPRYDDDIFGGVSGVKSSGSVVYEDVFSVGSSGPGNIEDLLGGFKAAEPGAKAKVASPARNRGGDASGTAFADLLPGFGNSEPTKPSRGIPDTNLQKPMDSSQKPANDPFVVLEADSFSSNGSSTTFHDPLEEFGIPTELTSTKDRKGSSNGTAGIDDIFDGFPQAAASSSSPIDDFGNEKSSLKTSRSSSPTQTNDGREAMESKSPKKASANNLDKNHTNIYTAATMADFDSPSGFVDSSTDSTSNRNKHSLQEDSTYASNMNSHDSSPPRNSHTSTEIVHDRWITVDEVQLCTQPTSAPPPLRPPPLLVIKQGPSYQKSAQPHKTFGAAFNFDKPAGVSSIDELEEFAMGGTYAQQQDEVSSYEEDVDNDSTAAASAAAMKEAMDRAEAKLKMARKVREKEKEAEERAAEEAMDEEEKERLARATQEAREREEREKEEREKMRREKEREREREREKQRFAVERATREARERAGAEARERAQRAAVERATREARERAAAEAKERAAAEVRERAERQAAERAAAEVRERAERQAAERAAAEARERAAAEAREKAAAERAAVERAAAEVRLRAQRAAVERATAEARERAAERVSAERAAAAKDRQMRTDNDLESFFSMGARASSAPKQRPATSEATFNAQSQSKVFSSEAHQRAPAGVPSGVRKASSAANIADDWTSIFTAPSADDFQEVEGETPERRRARLERHQRTRERAAKALAEKNERDMQAQRDQSERHRMAESLDAEIKRWAAGKEGNLRALLSTLQYVLWPEAGWQPASLTDVITGASVKKVYRKATLCVHPDKVQQKGATIQQKYVAEKVFDLLKEAWNKFNSEEPF